MITWQNKLAGLASEALCAELVAYPKAGLVSLVDSGSHSDMNSATFLASINALDEYWRVIGELGARGAPFGELVGAGKQAEHIMLCATQNVNTHRGAIFIMGILLAGVAYAYSHQLPFSQIPQIIRQLWGAEIVEHQTLVESHGNSIRQRYPELASNLLSTAASGFSELFDNYLPCLHALYPQYDERAYLEIFYRLLAEVNDNNLLYRGGAAGLKLAQNLAAKFVENGGISQVDWLSQATHIHKKFIQHNLSPGGCADLLAATIFLHSVECNLWA